MQVCTPSDVHRFYGYRKVFLMDESITDFLTFKDEHNFSEVCFSTEISEKNRTLKSSQGHSLVL